MPASDGVQAFRDPGSDAGLVLADEPTLDDAQASGRWIKAGWAIDAKLRR